MLCQVKDNVDTEGEERRGGEQPRTPGDRYPLGEGHRAKVGMETRMESCVVQQLGGVIGMVGGAPTEGPSPSLEAVGGHPTGNATDRPRGRPFTGKATDLVDGAFRKRNCI